jgi:hypothetical protein
MQRFLKNVIAVLKKTNHAKPAECREHPNRTPLPRVRSQVKAGMSFSWGEVGSPDYK